MTDLVVSKIAKQMPPQSDEEYAALKESIVAIGLVEPIWLYKGEILDGRHRYKACTETGVLVRTREYEGDQPVRFACDLNMRRRHLSTDQRVVLALALEPEYRKEAAARQATGKGEDGSGGRGNVKTLLSPDSKVSDRNTRTAHAQLGSLVGVSGRTIGRALDVRDGDRDLWKAFLAGELTITGAWRTLKGVPPDGRADSVKTLEVIENWDVPAPKGGKLRDWQRAFHDQKHQARLLAERERALNRQIDSIEEQIARRAKDVAAAEFQRIVKAERMLSATILAFVEGRVTMPRALALTRLTPAEFQRQIDDMRAFLTIHEHEGVSSESL
jgi:ParB-like chromosome segregation protein Spo0J